MRRTFHNQYRDFVPREIRKCSVLFVTTKILFCILLTMMCNLSDAHASESVTDKLFNNNIPNGIKEAAQKGLLPFLNAIPKQYLQQYHFSSEAEFALATLGEPYQLYKIDPDKILNYDGKSSIMEMIAPTDTWHFPVIVKSEIRSSLMVALMNGKWETVEIGGGLTKSWDAVLKRWPVSKGYRHVFVRVFQADADFVLLSNSGKITVMPLESAVRSLGMERGRAIEIPFMVSRLKQPVLDNIKSFNLKGGK